MKLKIQRLDATGLSELKSGHSVIIGWSEQAHLRLTAPSNPIETDTGVYAYIGESEGLPFLQPAEGGPALKHNGMPLLDSAWLKNGDVLQLDDLLNPENITVHLQGGQLTLEVRGTATDSAPLPPPVSPEQDAVSAPPAYKHEAPPPQPDRHGSSNTRRALLALFGLLIAAAAFVLLATSVELNIDPVPESAAIRGFPPVIEFAGKHMAIPGRYTVHADKNGYRPLIQDIEIKFQSLQRFDLQMQEKPGLLQISSLPVADALISINGEEVGKAPLNNHPLDAGSHEIRVEAPGHLPYQGKIDMVGKGQRQSLEVELIPGLADIHVRSEPAGARVSNAAGDDLGQTPITLSLIQGEHLLSLSLDKFKTASLPVSVLAQQDQDLPLVQLEPADGMLEIISHPADAAVMVDQRYRGRSPLTLQLSPDQKHQIQLNKAGYHSAKKTLSLGPDEHQLVELKLSPQYGTVFITSDPDDALLFVDGKPRGSATQRLRLTTRNHRISVRKAGYQDYQTSVRPRVSGAQTIDIALLRIGQKAPPAHSAATPIRLQTASGQTLKIVLDSSAVAEFKMGASRRQPGRRANETERKVTLKRPFMLSTREVSNAKYREFKPAHRSGSIQGHSLDTEKQPVVNISWDDSARYLNWLSRKDGLPEAYKEENGAMQIILPINTGYRLPTEAEWAYAARIAGSAQPVPDKFPWGSDFPPLRSDYNLADSNAIALVPKVVPGYNDGYSVSAPVGSFIPDASGIFDLSGNVAEWCLDFYAIKPGGSVDPSGPTQGKHHVVRGSGWRDASITELRWTYRDYSKSARNDLGFRIARYK